MSQTMMIEEGKITWGEMWFAGTGEESMTHVNLFGFGRTPINPYSWKRRLTGPVR